MPVNQAETGTGVHRRRLLGGAAVAAQTAAGRTRGEAVAEPCLAGRGLALRIVLACG